MSSVAYHHVCGRVNVGDRRPGETVTVTWGPPLAQTTEECRIVRAASGSLILVPLPTPEDAA